MEIKTERICCDECECYADDNEIIGRGIDGSYLCRRHVKAFMDDDYAAAIEWIRSAEFKPAWRFAKKRYAEERIIYPEGRETA